MYMRIYTFVSGMYMGNYMRKKRRPTFGCLLVSPVTLSITDSQFTDSDCMMLNLVKPSFLVPVSVLDQL